MYIAMVGVKLFLIVTHGVRLHAHSFTWMLIAILGVKRNARIEALCSLLNMK